MDIAAQLEADTIVAVATPPGRGGIGVVRLSGPAALSVATRIISLRTVPVARRAHYGLLLDAEGRRLDDAVLTWFQAPASYTGEDVVEVATHGAPVVQRAVVEAALRLGARLARPGEFTERAYLAGRLDLTAAEAVRDLIDAQTLGQARLAAEQMGGSLAREVAPVKQALVELIAALEAGIDFAEDDLETLSPGQIAGRIAPLLPPLQRLQGSFAQGRLLREGLRLAIVGRPNAGKSSLFNRLLGRDRSIVTPVAGTTRDVVGEDLVLDGIPVHLLDTAGLRDTADEVERLGIARSHEAIADADVVLYLVDATEATALLNLPQPAHPKPVDGRRSAAAVEAWEGNAPNAKLSAVNTSAVEGPSNAEPLDVTTADVIMAAVQARAVDALRASTTASASSIVGTTPTLLVWTKADLLPAGKRNWADLPERARRDERKGPIETALVGLVEAGPAGADAATAQTAVGEAILTSAITGEGIAALQAAILRCAAHTADTAPHAAMLSNLRQHGEVQTALKALCRAQPGLPHELLLLDLYRALEALDALTGTTAPDDILSLIFSTFCIGK